MLRHALALCLLLYPVTSLAAPARPRLAVLVVFDQLRATEIDTLAPFFENGFGGLAADHAAYYVALHRTATTETGPGHATLVTGAGPSVHGIVGNLWFELARKVYVTDDRDKPVIGSPAHEGASARNLAVPTLGDVMRLETNGAAKVVTVAVKDRAAILTGGKTANLALWFDAKQLRFTTSEAYAKALPPWAADLGRTLVEKSFAGGTWSPLPAPPALRALVPVDADASEGGLMGLGPEFPHDLKSLSAKDRAAAYRGMPQSMSDCFTLALAAIDGEGLGKDAAPDLLVVSISSVDYAGHWFGPGSLEFVDMVRRADLALREFNAALKKRLGDGGYALVVTSDHGGTQAPERARALGFDAFRTSSKELERVAEAAAHQAVAEGPAKRVLAAYVPHVFLDFGALTAAQREREVMAVRRALEALPAVAATYVPAELEESGDAFAPLYREAVFPNRNGQIFVRLKPRAVLTGDDVKTGSDHGSPYLYDQRVPLIVRGPGVRGGRYAEVVDARDVAPTLAFLLGMPPPDASSGRVVPAAGP